MFDRLRNYFNYLFTRNVKEDFICADCGFEIPIYTPYYRNEKTGEVLCKLCFDKRVRDGTITTDKIND